MHDEHASEQMRRRLLALHAALLDLRNGLCKMSVTLQEHSLQLDERALGAAKLEADDLFRRLRR